jgi:hypothetical protein
MNWFRSRSSLSSYLALFAVAFQLALSFGHVHLDRFAPVSADEFTLASADASSDARTAPANPPDREGLADDCDLHADPSRWRIDTGGGTVVVASERFRPIAKRGGRRV